MSEESTTLEEPITEMVEEAAEVVEEAAQGEAPKRVETGAILDELTTFGHKLAAAVQQAWESDQRKEIEGEIREGLRKAGERLDEVAEDLRGSDVTKDFKTRAGKVVDVVEESKLTHDVRRGLLAGLRRLNDELTELLDRDQAPEEAPAAPEAPAEPPEPPAA